MAVRGDRTPTGTVDARERARPRPGTRRGLRATGPLRSVALVALVVGAAASSVLFVEHRAGASTSEDSHGEDGRGDDDVRFADDAASARAAGEIAAARERANAVADDLWATQSAYDVLQADAERSAAEVARIEADMDALRGDVEAVAIARFMTSGASGIPLLTDVREPNERVRADVLTGVVVDVGATAVDDFVAVRTELDQMRAQITLTQQQLRQHQDRLERLRVEAEAEVQRLRALESQRLHDEAVQRALEAQRREEQRERDEAARREAEAARRAEVEAAEASGNTTTPTIPTADVAENLAGTSHPAATEPSAAPGSTESPAATVPSVSTTPASSVGTERRRVLSGASVGGRTGGGGGGSSPAVPTGATNPGGGPHPGTADPGTGHPATPYVDVMVCPVVGGSAYGDTWGAPRSGGRRHQGVDMVAPVGTLLVAVADGIVEQRTNVLGGITVTLTGDNGNRYYYAHLAGWEGEPGRVAQGQVIGYVGDTGNATGIPHLHFEIRPYGGVPVNPTPSVRAAGC